MNQEEMKKTILKMIEDYEYVLDIKAAQVCKVVAEKIGINLYDE